jgi:hypothetical protein
MRRSLRRDGITSSALALKKHRRCEKFHTADLRFELQTSWGTIRGETSMQRSHTNSQRSHGIWPHAPVSAIQIGILLAISLAVIFGFDRALDASRSRIAASRDTPAAMPGNCPQLAETFDSQRAACLRRRWSAMRNIRPWRDSSENALLEACLKSPGGEIAVPFKANDCSPQTSSPRLQAQN